MGLKVKFAEVSLS